MEFFRQNVIKGGDLLLSEVILFSGGVTNKIEEELEKRPLEIFLGILRRLILAKYMNNGLQRMLQIQRAIIRRYQFIRYDNQLGVVLNKRSID